jgi:hypothetical protein
MRMRHIAICVLTRSTKVFHVISQTARFSKKMLLNAKCVCFDFLYNFRPKRFSFQDEMSEIW